MTRRKSKYVHEGKYMAVIEVELVAHENEWAPYLTLEDAYKLDDVRDALRRGDLEAAAENAMIYELHPIIFGSGNTQPITSAGDRTPRH